MAVESLEVLNLLNTLTGFVVPSLFIWFLSAPPNYHIIFCVMLNSYSYSYETFSRFECRLEGQCCCVQLSLILCKYSAHILWECEM